jgi:hypothetical protein
MGMSLESSSEDVSLESSGEDVSLECSSEEKSTIGGACSEAACYTLIALVWTLEMEIRMQLRVIGTMLLSPVFPRMQLQAFAWGG